MKTILHFFSAEAGAQVKGIKASSSDYCHLYPGATYSTHLSVFIQSKSAEVFMRRRRSAQKLSLQFAKQFLFTILFHTNLGQFSIEGRKDAL